MAICSGLELQLEDKNTIREIRMNAWDFMSLTPSRPQRRGVGGMLMLKWVPSQGIFLPEIRWLSDFGETPDSLRFA